MDKRIDGYLHQLALRGFTPHYFERAEQALEYLFSQLPHDCAVGIGGSTTVTQLGVREALRARGNEVLFHSETPRDKMVRVAAARDERIRIYLLGQRHIGRRPNLGNRTAPANRLSALCYGPKRIFMLCGVNKLVDGGREEGAAPYEAARLSAQRAPAQAGHALRHIRRMSIPRRPVQSPLHMQPDAGDRPRARRAHAACHYHRRGNWDTDLMRSARATVQADTRRSARRQVAGDIRHAAGQARTERRVQADTRRSARRQVAGNIRHAARQAHRVQRSG